MADLNKRYHQQALRLQGIVDVKLVNQATTAYINTLQIPEDSSIKLRDIYHWNFVLTHYGAKQFNLAPQYTSGAQYIAVDSDVLHALVKASIDTICKRFINNDPNTVNCYGDGSFPTIARDTRPHSGQTG